MNDGAERDRGLGGAVVHLAVSAAVYVVLPFFWLPVVVRASPSALRGWATPPIRTARGALKKAGVVGPRWSRRTRTAAGRAAETAARRARRAYREARREWSLSRHRAGKRGRRFVYRWLMPLARRAKQTWNTDKDDRTAG